MRLEAISDDTLQQMIISDPLQIAGSKTNNNHRLTTKVKPTHKPKGSSWTYAKKPSIAAATILATITFCAIIFLLIWYLKRRRNRKARQRLDTENQLEVPFNESSFVLTEDSSKSLDEFLLKDIEPERISMMFSRNRSPSFTFVVDENDRRNPSRLYRDSYNAFSTSLSKLNSLTNVTTDRRSVVLSELAPSTSNSSSSGSGSGSGSGSVKVPAHIPAHTPTSHLSRALTGVSTAQSSTWTTTSASSRSSADCDIIPRDSAYCQNPARVRTVVSRPHDDSTNIIPVRSMVRANPSNASRASSRVSVSSPKYSAERTEQQGSSQTVHIMSHRGSMSLETPDDSSWSASGRASQLPSILSVSSPQSPVFGFSEG